MYLNHKLSLTLLSMTIFIFTFALMFYPADSQTTQHYYYPMVIYQPTPSPVPTAGPAPLPVPIEMVVQPPVDFAHIQQELNQQGYLLGLNKIGFHVGIGGNRNGIGEWMRNLDAAGVPFFLKSADDAGPIYEAQLLAQASGVPHILVYRRSGAEYDVPNYNLPPQQAAEEHWQRHITVFPPELDKNLVWLETINEVDKNRSVWLAEFALATAQLALRDGYKWAAFGWSSGEPEPEHWRSPQMLNFLRLVGQHPNQLAIALHEYSYTTSSIGNWYPHLTGRFQALFQVCDEANIPRPTVLITEWGWEYQHVPSPAEALADIRWAAWLYSAYPEVKGAAIWYLGGGFGEIANEANALMTPLEQFALSHYFKVTPGRGSIDATLFQPSTDPQIWDVPPRRPPLRK
jgi:hypothetical protein